MITERRTRLHRAPTLPAFRAALARLVPITLDAARATAVILPSRSAAALFARGLERGLADGGALVLPDLVSRRDFYDRLHARTPALPRQLTEYERDVLVEAAAHEAITEGDTPPFHLRPALVEEMLALYDGLKRRQIGPHRFEEQLIALFEEAADYDRGAERLLRQTRFLARTFHGYQRRVAALGVLDEHVLRERLLEEASPRPYRNVVVAVGDEEHEAGGLARADFDLLTRLPGLEAIDLVATEDQLETGLWERLHDLLPGLEDIRVPPPETPLDSPVLLVPDTAARSYSFSSRDREEELADLVRRIRALHREQPDVPLDRIGVVVGRPLPYVYLARGIFAAGGVPFQSRDALPLAAEPAAAALDLVFSVLSTEFAAGPLCALLRSPYFSFASDHVPLAVADVAALEVGLSAVDRAGDAESLESLATAWDDQSLAPPRDPRWSARGAARAARAGARALRALKALAPAQPAGDALTLLLDFLAQHLVPVADDDPLADRDLRARQAILTILAGLRDAHRIHHDLRWTVDDVAATSRRWIEGETFTPAAGTSGVMLIDRAAAPFGDFADLHLAGLVDGEWPARTRRNIFYSQRVLATIGWTGDPDRTAAARASFVDLLQSPQSHVSLSGFALEDDALVDASPLLADVPRAGLTTVTLTMADTIVFTGEAMMVRPIPPTLASRVSEETTAWLALRSERPDFTASEFHGRAMPQPPRPWSVSALDLYGQCPFKFFARYVLKLGEERPDDDGLSPLERGRLIHEVFESFYRAWQQRGRTTIGPDRLDEAAALAAEILEQRLKGLPPSDAAIERTRFLGSPVAPGLIDVVLRMEAEREGDVIERWLEHRLDGNVVFRGEDGPETIAIRGVADRVDLLADGTFRVVDYKSSRASGPLQLATYATALTQQLAGHRGRNWMLAEAAYVAFREDPPVRPLARNAAELDGILAREEARVVRHVAAISRGEFPPRPVLRSLCASCAWANVCRKDYVEAVDPAPAV